MEAIEQRIFHIRQNKMTHVNDEAHTLFTHWMRVLFILCHSFRFSFHVPKIE